MVDKNHLLGHHIIRYDLFEARTHPFASGVAVGKRPTARRLFKSGALLFRMRYGFANYKSRQMFDLIAASIGYHSRFSHAVKFSQIAFDIAELDAIAVPFNLLINAPFIIKQAVRPVIPHIAGTISPFRVVVKNAAAVFSGFL